MESGLDMKILLALKACQKESGNQNQIKNFDKFLVRSKDRLKSCLVIMENPSNIKDIEIITTQHIVLFEKANEHSKRNCEEDRQENISQMNYCDIYLHEDTLLINENILSEIIENLLKTKFDDPTSLLNEIISYLYRPGYWTSSSNSLFLNHTFDQLRQHMQNSGNKSHSLSSLELPLWHMLLNGAMMIMNLMSFFVLCYDPDYKSAWSLRMFVVDSQLAQANDGFDIIFQELERIKLILLLHSKSTLAWNFRQHLVHKAIVFKSQCIPDAPIDKFNNLLYGIFKIEFQFLTLLSRFKPSNYYIIGHFTKIISLFNDAMGHGKAYGSDDKASSSLLYQTIPHLLEFSQMNPQIFGPFHKLLNLMSSEYFSNHEKTKSLLMASNKLTKSYDFHKNTLETYFMESIDSKKKNLTTHTTPFSPISQDRNATQDLLTPYKINSSLNNPCNAQYDSTSIDISKYELLLLYLTESTNLVLLHKELQAPWDFRDALCVQLVDYMRIEITTMTYNNELNINQNKHSSIACYCKGTEKNKNDSTLRALSWANHLLIEELHFCRDILKSNFNFTTSTKDCIVLHIICLISEYLDFSEGCIELSKVPMETFYVYKVEEPPQSLSDIVKKFLLECKLFYNEFLHPNLGEFDDPVYFEKISNGSHSSRNHESSIYQRFPYMKSVIAQLSYHCAYLDIPSSHPCTD